MLNAIETGNVEAIKRHYATSPSPPERLGTWMHVAALRGKRVSVETLFELDSESIYQTSNAEMLPIILALSEQNTETLETLIHLHGKGPDFKFFVPFEHPLIVYAVAKNMTKSVSKLIELGASLEWKHENGDDLLNMAASYGNLECVKILCRTDRQWPSAVNRWRGPYHAAAIENQGACIRALYDSGYKDIDAQSQASRTPLHEASVYESMDAVVALHALGSEAHFVVDVIGSSPATFEDWFAPGIECVSKTSPRVRRLYFSRSLAENLFFIYDSDATSPVRRQ